MATPGAVQTDISNDRSVIKAVWELTSADHTGAAIRTVEFSSVTCGAVGTAVAATFGGATCIFEGSLDGVNFSALSEVTGTPIAFTGVDIMKILEEVQFIRPRLSVVGTLATITATLMAKQQLNTRTS